MLVPGAMGNQVLIGGSSEDTGCHSGVRIRGGGWIDRDHSIGFEGSYFFLGLQSNDSSASSMGMPLLGVPFLTTGGRPGTPVILAGGGLMGGAVAEVKDRLWGAEANFRHNLKAGPNGFLDLILGFRAIGLDDDFSFTTSRTNGAGATLLTFDSFATRNRVYAGQIGLEGERQWGPWSLNATAKIGVGGNDVDTDIGGTSSLGSLTAPTGLFAQRTNSGRHKHDSCVVVPEIGLKVGYQVNSCTRLSLGYNFLFISQVARAGEQIDPVLAAAGHPAFAFNSSSFWAQGLTAGLEFRY
jgi:hypothetical protein